MLPSVGIRRWSGRELSFPLINTCLLVTPRQPPCRSLAHFVTPFLLRDFSTFRQLEQQTQATSARLRGKEKKIPQLLAERLAPCPSLLCLPLAAAALPTPTARREPSTVWMQRRQAMSVPSSAHVPSPSLHLHPPSRHVALSQAFPQEGATQAHHVPRWLPALWER